jgi:hypothetical protein
LRAPPNAPVFNDHDSSQDTAERKATQVGAKPDYQMRT